MIGFKIIKAISFTNLFPNMVIITNNGKYYCNNVEIPFFNEKLINEYCIEVEIFERTIDYNQEVYFPKTTGGVEFQKGKIINFNEFTGEYQVQYSKGIYNYNKWLRINDIIIPQKYYFLSSKGIVQSDYTYRDEKVDKWRKAVGNFFEDKKDCQAYRQKIIDSFKK